MTSEVLLVYHPNNRVESEHLMKALEGPLRQTGIELSGTAMETTCEPLLPQREGTISTVIAMIGSDGSAPTINLAAFSEETPIVPTLIQASPGLDIKVPAEIKQRSLLAFEVSLSDAAGLSRLTSAILQLARRVGGLNHSLPEALVNALFESTVRFYEETAQEYINTHKEIPEEQKAEISSFMSQVKQRHCSWGKPRILDAGCGPGHHARFFAEYGLTVIGIDCCSRFIQHALENPIADCSFVEGDMRELDSYFPPECVFDGIWASASCLHLPREVTAGVLDQFRNHLRPNGVLGISFQLGMSTLQRDGRFFERYDKDEVIELLRQHGFTVIETLRGQTTLSTTLRTRTKEWLSIVALPVDS